MKQFLEGLTRKLARRKLCRLLKVRPEIPDLALGYIGYFAAKTNPEVDRLMVILFGPNYGDDP